MATLAVVVWLFVIFLFFYGSSLLLDKAFESDTFGLPKAIFTIWLTMHVVIIWPLSLAIYWDLYGKMPPSLDVATFTPEVVRYALILGFVALGITSLSSIVIRQRVNFSNRGMPKYNQQQGKKIAVSVKFVFDIIGFIASVLGIISFYLNHLR